MPKPDAVQTASGLPPQPPREGRHTKTQQPARRRVHSPKATPKGSAAAKAPLAGPVWKLTYCYGDGVLRVAWYVSDNGADVHARHWLLQPSSAIHGVQRMAADEEAPAHAVDARGASAEYDAAKARREAAL